MFFLKMRYAWRESQANAEFLARNIVQQHGVRFRVSALDPLAARRLSKTRSRQFVPR